jgi:ketosteroid isomerase-like protein
MKQIYFSFFMIALGCFSCKTNQDASTGNATKDIDDIRQTDLAFSKLSLDSGMAVAFVTYADNDVIKMNDGSFPIIGKNALQESFGKRKRSATSSLTWEPTKVEVAKSADLGYTFGNWEFKRKLPSGTDTVFYGNYVTVWKKQSDGKWKMALDGGNSTPNPNVKQ